MNVDQSGQDVAVVALDLDDPTRFAGRNVGLHGRDVAAGSDAVPGRVEGAAQRVRGGSARAGARSEARTKQQLAAGGRSLPRPGARSPTNLYVCRRGS